MLYIICVSKVGIIHALEKNFVFQTMLNLIENRLGEGKEGQKSLIRDDIGIIDNFYTFDFVARFDF